MPSVATSQIRHEPAPLVDAAPGEVTPAEAAAPVATPEAEDASPEAAAEAAAEPQTEMSSASAHDAAPSADVGALFERLRSGQPEATAEEAPAPAPAMPAAEPEAPEPGAEPGGEAAPEAAAPALDTTDLDALAAEDQQPAPDAEVVARRDETLADAADKLARRGKRALQDEQNDLLDALRRQRGRIDVSKVLPSREDQLTRWAHVLQPAVDVSYVAGAATIAPSATRKAAPRALLQELAAAVVDPLRDRVSASIASVDISSPADTEIALAQRIGARYREWRTQDLETGLGDALAAAYSRGVYDAAPPEARLRWVPPAAGKCADCDDNALEPTVKGADFPTGQAFPPAHPGCRCVLVLDDATP